MTLQTINIHDDLLYIGVNDRNKVRFENLWPLPNGVSYNSYLLTGEKTALMDTVEVTRVDTFLSKLEEGLEGRELDYLVVQHMEPDHASSVPTIVENYPGVQIVGNAKTRNFMQNFFELEDLGFDYDKNFLEVKEGDQLDLGDSTLTFYMTPMVHWPESMVSFQEETGVLFSQDAFGSYGALDGGIFDDEVDWGEKYLDETIRYYANIVAPFSFQTLNAIEKLGGLDIKMICPVHGVIWREDPGKIVGVYQDLASQKTEEGAVVVYGSMYGNTREMAEIVARSIAEEGIKPVKVYDVSDISISYIAADIWRYSAVVIGSVTYQNGMYPQMQSLLNTLEGQRMKDRILGIFGSHSWAGKSLSILQDFADRGDYDQVETTVDVKSSAKADDVAALKQIGKEVAEKLKARR